MLVSDDAKVDEDTNPSSLGNEPHTTHINTKVSIPDTYALCVGMVVCCEHCATSRMVWQASAFSHSTISQYNQHTWYIDDNDNGKEIVPQRELAAEATSMWL